MSLQKFIPSEGQGPFSPRDRITFDIPMSAGVLDLSKACLVGKVDILSDSGTTIDGTKSRGGFELISGVLSAIRDVRVSTLDGILLEELHSQNILAAFKEAFLSSDTKRGYQERVELVRKRLMDADGSYASWKFSQPLTGTNLGIMSVDEFPAWKKGLRVEFLLEESKVPFRQRRTNHAFTCFDQDTVGATTLDLADVCREMSARIRYFGPGQDVVVKYSDAGAAGALVYEVKTIAIIDWSDRYPTLTFTSAMTNAGKATDPVVFADEFDIAPNAATSFDLQNMTLDNCPLFVGQGFSCLYTDGTKKKKNIRVTALSTSGANVRVTFAPALDNAGSDIHIYEIAVNDLVWTLSDLSLEIPTMPRAPSKSGKSPKMIFPIRSVQNFREQLQPSMFSEVVIPSTDVFERALGLFSIPIDIEAAIDSFDGSEFRLMGFRDGFSRMQVLVDGSSSPMNPIEMSRSIEPYLVSQISSATSQCMGSAITRVTPDYCVFPKAFSAFDTPSDLRGKRVAVRFERDTTIAASALMLNTFVFAMKDVVIA